ncbi:MAG: glycosyl hydrolase, repeat protein [Acidobacteriales bacterium]|nr:glycosyl hydrolase, repeat protein [Terriglobales bacterium]
MNRAQTKRLVSLAFAFLFLLCSATAQQFTPLGPDGGDVRSLARDPHSPNRILLGTSAGQIYQSTDGGANWARYAKLGDHNDYVLDRVVFHPTRAGIVYAAAWSVESNGGDIYRSADGGRNWKFLNGMHGKSIRGFSMSLSNPDVLVAGALDGVFRSNDGGDHWDLISPPNHPDIRNIQSIAIDPVDSNIIYAGTWHLPWKTTDGGQTWKNMKNGIIDDSDVFSIIIDPVLPSTMYVSACSGIYKSDSSGASFRKVQGMPFSARRTRVLKQDPVNRNIVYAGTTEGLWKTTDSGAVWKRITGANIIVNDVLVDPADHSHVMIATDRSGVLASTDSGEHFVVANRGFAHRQVASMLIDRDDSSTIYAGLINDKEFGGIFVTHNGGAKWQQMNEGLNGRDVFTLRQSPKGELIAGTNNGIVAFRQPTKASTPQWVPLNNVINIYETVTRAATKKSKPVIMRKTEKSQLTARVNDVEFTPEKWFAATSAGIFVTRDEGRTWHGGPVQNHSDFLTVKSSPQLTVAITRRALFVSTDAGETWHATAPPENITGIADVALAEADGSSDIFLATREGAYRSVDAGASWEHLRRLPVNQLASLAFDPENQRLIAISHTSTEIFASADLGKSWKRLDTGWTLRSVRSVRGRFLATTAFDGIVAQPEIAAPSAATAVTSSGGNASSNSRSSNRQ